MASLLAFEQRHDIIEKPIRKRIGIFVDVSNYYYSIKAHFGKHLNYTKYLTFLEPFGTPTMMRAYGAQRGGEAKAFIAKLNELGFETFYKEPKIFRNRDGGVRRKADWDVGITVDILENLHNLDFIVLGTADSDLAPLVEYILKQGKQVIIFACGISKELSDLTEALEITQSLME